MIDERGGMVKVQGDLDGIDTAACDERNVLEVPTGDLDVVEVGE